MKNIKSNAKIGYLFCHFLQYRQKLRQTLSEVADCWTFRMYADL